MPKVDELLKIAGELMHFANSMPSDPYARRWRLAAMAMIAQANAMSG